MSARIHAAIDLNGTGYRSRLNPDQFCAALFDRTDHKVASLDP